MPNNFSDIIVFGGTFDPPHLGHRELVLALSASYPLATILIMPAKIPPVSNSQTKPTAATFEHRLNMAKLCFTGISANVRVSSLEQELPTPNYTYNLAAHLHTLYPNSRLSIVVGTDQWLKFDQWYQAAELLKLCNILVFNRGPKLDHSLDMPLKTLNLKYSVISTKRIDILSSDTHVLLNDQLNHPASSQELRKELSAHALIHKDWLAVDVLNYMNQHHLYE